MTRRGDIAFRPSTRLRDFDYRSCFAYFVTLCVADRRCVFGTVAGHEVSLTRRGLVARDCWLDIPRHHRHVELDAFVVMPNHLHGILRFEGDVPPERTTGCFSPVVATPASRSPRSGELKPLPAGPAAGSLGAVVGSYKAAVTRAVNRLRPGAGRGLWQRNFHDHVIRTDRALDRIREYVQTNPGRWSRDAENPDGDGTDDVRAFMLDVARREVSPLRGERDAGVATTVAAPAHRARPDG